MKRLNYKAQQTKISDYKIVRTCILILALVLSTSISSQPFRDILGRMPTPHATDLGRYGDIPVSYHTGRGGISVPVHHFEERGISMDINLIYDTSGILLNKLPGPLGSGWTLDAGGCITRIQNNFCDEMQFHNEFPSYNLLHNYFSSHSDMINSDGSLRSDILSNESYLLNDYSPDIFYFNFMGMSGHFFLGNDGQWKVSSDNNIAVDFDINDQDNYIQPVISTYPGNSSLSQPHAIKGFILYDDQGNKYTFGHQANAIEYSTDLFHSSSNEKQVPWVATSWYLTKVQDRLGVVLYELTYCRGKFQAQLFRTTITTEIEVNGHSSSSTSSPYSGTLNLPVFLTAIEARGGDSLSFHWTKAFDSDETSRQLYPSLYTNGSTSLSIFPINGNYGQYQSYYLQAPSNTLKPYRSTPDNNYGDDPLAAIDFQVLSSIRYHCGGKTSQYQMEYSDTGRVHLSGIKLFFIGAHGQASSPYCYTFIYNYYEALPADYLSNQHDHWGYYNGGNTSDRLPRLYQAKAGMLKKIVYPTGGSCQIEYELNDYSSYLSPNRQEMEAENGTAGGLRVHTIQERSASDEVTNREFIYKDETGASSGQLFAKPQYGWYWQAGNYLIQSYQSLPVIPLFTSAGPHIGYSQVTERFGDGSTHQYHFSNFSEMKDCLPVITSSPFLAGQPGTVSPYDHFGDRGVMRGRLLSFIIKNPEGETEQSTYRQDTTAFLQQFSYASNFTVLVEGNCQIHGVGCIYKLFYPKYDIVSTNTTTKYGESTVSEHTSYSMTDFNAADSPFPRFRKCTSEFITRNGTSLEHQYRYKTDAPNPCFLPRTSTTTCYNNTTTRVDSTCYSVYFGKFLPQQEMTFIGGSSTPLNIVTYDRYSSSGQLLTFKEIGNYYPTQLFWNNKDRLIASVMSPYERALDVTNTYLVNGIPMLETAQMPDSIDYDPSAAYQGLSPLDVVKYQGQSIFSYPEVKATTYVYDGRGKPVAMASENGVISYYNYDRLGRLTSIRNHDFKLVERYKYHFSSEINNISPPLDVIQ